MFGYVLFLGSSACKLTPCLCVPLHAPVLLVSVSWASSSPTRDTSFSRTCQRLLCAATQEIPGFAPRARYVVLLWSTSVSPWLDEFTGVELGGGWELQRGREWQQRNDNVEWQRCCHKLTTWTQRCGKVRQFKRRQCPRRLINKANNPIIVLIFASLSPRLPSSVFSSWATLKRRTKSRIIPAGRRHTRSSGVSNWCVSKAELRFFCQLAQFSCLARWWICQWRNRK